MACDGNDNGENCNKIAENHNEDDEDSEDDNINHDAITRSQLTEGGKGKNGWSAKGIGLCNNMFEKVVADQKNNGEAFDISFKKNCKNESKFLPPARTDNENNDLMPTAANCLQRKIHCCVKCDCV